MKKRKPESQQLSNSELEKKLAEKTAELELRNRELEIEAALDNVRSRTIAMKRSEELADAASVLFKQLRELGGNLWSTGFVLIDNQNREDECWMSNPEGEIWPPIFIPNSKDPAHKKMYDHWVKGEDYCSIEEDGKILKDHYLYLMTLPKAGKVFKDLIEAGIPLPTWQQYHAAYFTHGYLLIITLEPTNESNLFKRFAKVFDQTYTRFLDLKRAEEQAREAQIEVSMERVRSRTMAMHKSEELGEVAVLLYEELIALNLTKIFNCGYVEVDEKNKSQQVWMTKPDGTFLGESTLPLIGDSILDVRYEAWKRKDPIFFQQVAGDDLKQHLEFVAPQIEFKNLFPNPSNFYCSNFSHGYLHILTGVSLSTEEESLLSRFTRVFEMTYSRFLDLKKAETQAREAQIEAGLERVRARAMVMHKSEELGDSAIVLYRELIWLGITDFIICGYVLVDEKSKRQNGWLTTLNGDFIDRFILPLKGDHVLQERYNAWKRKDPVFSQEVGGDKLKKHAEFVIPYFDSPPAEDIARDEMPDPTIFYCCNFSEGYLHILASKHFSNEEESVLARFTKVFEMSYRRFLDLKKAEEQAREAQIEASLERVRARAMGMHSSEELLDVASQLYKELADLGVPQYMTGFVEVDEANQQQVVWVTAPNGKRIGVFFLPIKGDSILKKRYESWEKKVPVFHQKVSGSALLKHMAYVSQHFGSEEAVEMGSRFPDTIIFYCGNFSAGYLHVLTEKKLNPEQESILLRFTQVFAMTYRRFLDLKKAEAQAREAKIETALERVRARALAMHTSEELYDVANVLREQMGLLGQTELEASVIHIYEEGKKTFESWYAVRPPDKSDGKILNGLIHFGYEDTEIAKDLLKLYKGEAKEYTVKYSGVNMKEWVSEIGKKAPEIKKSWGNNPPEYQIFHFSDFSGGSLIMVSYEDPAKESMDLQKRAALVFDLAYRRFLDLKKAEAQAREAQVEAALERVRARSMAMHQSEELSDCATVLFRELTTLGGSLWSCGFVILEDDVGGEGEFYSTDPEGEVEPAQFIPNVGDPTTQFLYEGWKQGEAYHKYDLSGKDIKEHYEYMLALPKSGHVFQAVLDAGIDFPVWQQMHASYFKHGYLLAITLEPFNDSTLLMRFAQVFEQTYTRFLDLKKAEAQAREAQIETALEKIRSKSLAMHESRELLGVIKEVFIQLNELGLYVEMCCIDIFDENSRDLNLWVATPEGDYPQKVIIPIAKYPILSDYVKSKAKGEKFIKANYSKSQKDAFFKYAFVNSDLKDAPKKRKDFIYKSKSFTRSAVIAKDLSTWMVNYDNQIYSHDQDEILIRLTRVFEQSYTRFLDLQKAEEQAREAQIEAALERVRTRSMAMHNSDELADLSFELVKQVHSLGIATWFCAFNIYDEDQKGSLEWGSNLEGTYKEYRTPREGIFLRYYKAGQRGETLLINEIGEKECPAHYDYLCSLPGVGDQLLKMKNVGISFPTSQIDHVAYFKYGYILFITFSPVPEAHDIFKRFAKVFEQTYTRFLDLKKAEAQAREAQIEAALERVRSKSIGMQKSEELKEVIRIIFDQLALLDINAEHAGIVVDYKAKQDWNFWIAETQDIPSRVTIPYLDSLWDRQYVEAKEKGKDFFATQFNFEEKNSFYQELLKYIPGLTKKARNFYLNCPGLAISTVIQDDISLYIENFSGTPYSDEENNILMRFGKVFQQTYTRFLDLQKAEEQAREAKIEAGLERVRASTMAMHKSEQLSETAMVLFDQFYQLGQVPDRIGIAIFNPAKKNFEIRATDQSGSQLSNSYNATIEESTTIHKIYKAWKNKEKSTVIKLTGQNLKKWIRFVKEEMKLHVDEKNIHGRRIHHAAFFSHGFLLYTSNTNMKPEFINLLVRCASVFDQTYTRFLDLKRAEMQAREAQIEASLERVRARTMAMNNSDELREVVAVVFNELQLSFENQLCILSIFDWESKEIEWWSTGFYVEVLPESYKIPIHEEVLNHPLIRQYRENQKAGISYSVFKLAGENKRTWDDYIFRNSDVKKMPLETQQGMQSFEEVYLSDAYMTKGVLEIAGPDPLSNDKADVIQRFATVIDLTYKRVEDLQQAEARALEAVRQASLDRVRGVIASMRTKEDLNRITPLIWKELTALNVPFIRCGVFIMDVENEVIQSFLSTPDGKTLGVFNLPFTSELIGELMVDFWEKGKIYKDHWTKKKFLEFMQKLKDSGQLKDTGSYQGTAAPPEKLDLHFIPFKQGMLYVGNTEPLRKNQLQLVKSLAEAFSIAYARYEDFRELELAKNQIESTLNELKSTQSQLIHAEKMASLGELTAGIAHEIQNPLNFVNNFSEVSVDLIEELKIERTKIKSERDESLEEEILGDVIQNLEKINHHGQRASSIVKGMLEHSRTGSKEKQLTDINALADEYLRLAYHGLRAKDKSFNADFNLEIDEKLPKIKVFPQDIGRVLLNLINNAFYATNKKAKHPSPKASDVKVTENSNYKPQVSVSTKKVGDKVEIRVKDNGEGIPEKIREKIFQPFFTTKPTGSGTGLGLSLSYDIVKAHGGELKVETQEGEGTEFIIHLHNLQNENKDP